MCPDSKKKPHQSRSPWRAKSRPGHFAMQLTSSSLLNKPNALSPWQYRPSPPHPSSQGPGGNSAERESESVSELCCGQIFLTHQVAICRAQEREEGGKRISFCSAGASPEDAAGVAGLQSGRHLPPSPAIPPAGRGRRRQPITEGCVELRSLRPSKHTGGLGTKVPGCCSSLFFRSFLLRMEAQSELG